MIGCPRRPLLSHFTPLLCAHTEERTARVNEQALCTYAHAQSIFLQTVGANIAIMHDYQCAALIWIQRWKFQYTLLVDVHELNSGTDGSELCLNLDVWF